jgi:hypothetical protein
MIAEPSARSGSPLVGFCLRATLAFGVAACVTLAAASARGQSTSDSAAAQALFDQAKQLLADGHAADACPKLEESQRLEPRSGTLINLASCYEQTGRLASAWSKYIEAATAAKASGNPDRETGARERAAALAPRLSKLTITVAPALKSLAGLEIRRDGVVVREPEWDLALPCDSGDHEITAQAPDHAPFKTKVTVAGEGQTTTVSVPELVANLTRPIDHHDERLYPPLATQPKDGLGTARTVALVAGGVGVVGVGLGTAFGLMSKAKHDDAAKYCNGAPCTDERGVTDGNAAQSDGNISTAMMIVGGVGLTAGITLWLTAPKAGTPAAQVSLGLGTLEVEGAF